MSLPPIELPWPDKRLHPNARVHRMRKAAAAKKARLEAAWLTREAKMPKLASEALHVTVTFHPPDKRRRDADGMLASIKSHLDGIADQIGIDDSQWDLTIRRASPRAGGAVVVVIEQAA